jgi:hypothetical protein
MRFISALQVFATSARVRAIVSSFSVMAIVVVGAAGTKWT